jgi:hypothetical protein
MKLLASFLLFLVISLLAGSADAQQAPCQPRWLPTFGGPPGIDGEVYALTAFDDGSGSALYAGGLFSSAAGVPVNNVARWDGARWSPLGDGTSSAVHALAVFDDGSGSGPELYAGGYFKSAGGLHANYIAKWNGTAWSPLGTGVSGGGFGYATVDSLAVFDDGSGSALYAGGFFNSASGVTVKNVAKWGGPTSGWSAVGAGLRNDVVSALAVFDDGSGGGPQLYAGGDFTASGTVPLNFVAKWDGSVWLPLGSGMSDPVSALLVFDDGLGGGQSLYAGGAFTTAGGIPALGVAKWSGTTWTAPGVMGSGLSSVRSLAVFNDGRDDKPALYAGGEGPANHIAKWDGMSWSTFGGAGLSGGQPTTVSALAVFDDGTCGMPALYVGGDFTGAGGVAAKHVAKWDGSRWALVGKGNEIEGSAYSLATFDDGSGAGSALYVGGRFISAGGVLTNHIAGWDGHDWSALAGDVGSGINSSGWVAALTVFDDGSGTGPALYVGGPFTSAGGVLTDNVARWNGTTWSKLGDGVNGSVRAFAVFDDESGAGPSLYAGGYFTSAGGVPASKVAKWDGSSWSALGSGVTGTFSPFVYALAVFDDGSGPALYAGGDFTIAGGQKANYVARWDGTRWSALGNGISGSFGQVAVRALQVFDDGSGTGPALYAGGYFDGAGGVQARGIARWDGSHWSAVGNGLRSTGVRAMTVFDDGTGGGSALYAGGEFNVPRGIAKWDGSSWTPLGKGVGGIGGIPGQVLALSGFDEGLGTPALYAGGTFLSAGGLLENGIAKWGCHSLPPASSFCAAKTTLSCGAAIISASGLSSATKADGFLIRAQPVLSCRSGLLLYSNQPARPGVQFAGPGNGLLCLTPTSLRRAGPIESGGGRQLCDGVMSIDMNAFNVNNWTATGCNPPPGQNNPAGFLSNPGTTVNAQMWGRDSIATGQVLSDGISWVVGP